MDKTSAIEQISSFFDKLAQTTKTHYSHNLRIANFFLNQTQYASLLMIITNQSHAIFLHYFALFYKTIENLFFANNNIVMYGQKKPKRPEDIFGKKTYGVEQNQKKKQEPTRPKRPNLLTKKLSKTR